MRFVSLLSSTVQWVITATALSCAGCGSLDIGSARPNTSTAEVPGSFELVARIAHISDAQILDEESPARFTPLDGLFVYGWRPQEAYSVQLLDGMVRAINRTHATGSPVDFVVHTGDATDNNQLNEWRWFMKAMDGGEIDPLSGIDDRAAAAIPPVLLDPHAPLQAQGLYREGVHGPLPSIPWYAVVGNHDRFAVGNFRIYELADGQRFSPTPIPLMIALFFPTALDPVGNVGFGIVTPNRPGPPGFLNFREAVVPNADRRYLSEPEVVDIHHDTLTNPIGHGFSLESPDRMWYHTSPVPGVRLIVLNTSEPGHSLPGFPYVAGSILAPQRDFLEDTLRMAERQNEWVIVATHHPSQDMSDQLQSALNAEALRETLRGSDRVIMHLCGHTHRNRVIDRGTYLEIETASTLDFPQEGRFIEIWEGPDGDGVVLQYNTFSHLPDAEPNDDPFYALRREAMDRAVDDFGLLTALRVSLHSSEQSPDDIQDKATWLRGEARDRSGAVILRNPARR